MSNLTISPFRIGNFDIIFDNKKQRSSKRPLFSIPIYFIERGESGRDVLNNLPYK